MNEKVIVLPNREEMLERLKKINDISHTQERFYPKLLKDAGKTINAQGVVMMLVLAIHDYSVNLSPMISNILYEQAPEFIDALVDDPEVAQEAKMFLAAALARK